MTSSVFEYISIANKNLEKISHQFRMRHDLMISTILWRRKTKTLPTMLLDYPTLQKVEKQEVRYQRKCYGSHYGRVSHEI